MPQFTGIRPYIDTANAATHSLTAAQVGLAKILTPVARAQQAIAQAYTGPATTAHRNACVAQAQSWRDVLMLATDGIERSIAQACSDLSLSAPSEHPNAGES